MKHWWNCWLTHRWTNWYRAGDVLARGSYTQRQRKIGYVQERKCLVCNKIEFSEVTLSTD